MIQISKKKKKKCRCGVGGGDVIYFKKSFNSQISLLTNLGKNSASGKLGKKYLHLITVDRICVVYIYP